jgi:hypothetical protein
VTLPGWAPLSFLAYPDTVDRPNVIVDGRANEATVLTLSHWPQAPTPPALRRDSSAEIAFAYLGAPSRHGSARWVSNNHFDQDGLVSVYALCEPTAAAAHEDLLIDVAWAGDFAVSRNRRAARISMAIAAFVDPERSPLGADAVVGDYDRVCAALYPEVLDRLPEMLEHPERYRSLWGDEDAQLDEDERLMTSGGVTIAEVPDLDLTVVTLPEGHRSAGGHRFGANWSERIHPVALHGRVDGFAVLIGQGDWWELRYRYESWVQFVSRPVRPRVDLGPTAAELTALEPDRSPWTFDGVAGLTPALHRVDDGPTGIDPEVVRLTIERALRTSVPAWDPYASSA